MRALNVHADRRFPTPALVTATAPMNDSSHLRMTSFFASRLTDFLTLSIKKEVHRCLQRT